MNCMKEVFYNFLKITNIENPKELYRRACM